MKPIAWVVYGSLDQRTGGTIYDAIVVAGLGDVDVISITRGDAPDAIVQRVGGASIVVGDELCFRELAAVFPRLAARRVLLVHHLTCWEDELPSTDNHASLRALELAAVRAADHVVTTSETTRTRLRAEGIDATIAVVLPGSDRLSVTPRSIPAVPTFLFVGSVIPRKRVRELMHAFRTLPSGTARLRLAGSLDRDPAYAAEVRALADASFLGEIDEAALARELAGATALVMPSSLEGYGMAATEAIAAGVPVIAARAAGLVEALAPCPGAVHFVDDVPSLANALAAVIHDCARMSQAARQARMPRWSETIASFRAELGVTE